MKDLINAIQRSSLITNLEDASSEERENITEILNSIGDSVIIADLEENTCFLNKEAERMTGWKNHEAVGRKVTEVFRLINGKTGEPLSSPCAAAICHKNAVGLMKETQLIARDGTKSFISASCAPLMRDEQEIQGTICVFRDITRLRQMENETVRHKDNMDMIFNNMPVGMIIVNEEGCIKYINDTLCDLFEIKKDSVVNDTLGASLLCSEDWDKKEGCNQCKKDVYCTLMSTVRATIKSGEVFRGVEVRVAPSHHNSRRETWLSIHSVPVVFDNSIHATITVEDITHKKKSQLEMDELRASYQALFDNMKSGACIFEAVDNGTDFIYKDINVIAERMDNLKKEDVIGKKASSTFSVGRKLSINSTLQHVYKTGETLSFPLIASAASEIISWREAYVYKLPTGDQVII